RFRREATAELRESEARFRNMADHAPVMMWVSDATGFCTYFNRLWYEFTGLTSQQSLGFGAFAVVHPDDRAEAERVHRAANSDRRAFRLELRLRRADGIYRWVLGAATPRLDGAGDFMGYIGSIVDVTDLKEAEQVLQQANEHLERRVSAALAERAEAEA